MKGRRPIIQSEVRGRDSTAASTAACADILHCLALGSLGPEGKHKVIQANESAGALTVTSVGLRLFEGMVLEHPITRLLVQSSLSAQARSCHDGGLLCLTLAAALVRHAARLPGPTGVHESACIHPPVL
mmetsp:Transcript_37281/g.117308  ORF Transcript_37281/g.117308 Transcript_37281/m.117308 type:complete len:129 (+) Transcript_37281:1645-2031(+)